MASLQLSFELPPPAVAGSSDPNTPGTPFPMQASETVKSRRRSSAANGHQQKDQFALPPPPTRSRKIIQMKPREEAAPAAAASGLKAASKTGAGGAASTTQAAGTKRKQPSATSAAGRKIARKTAHSLIERRRRSKMNEEFAVLKSLIPACTGEMHKLAILQVSHDCSTEFPLPTPRRLTTWRRLLLSMSGTWRTALPSSRPNMGPRRRQTRSPGLRRRPCRHRLSAAPTTTTKTVATPLPPALPRRTWT